MSSGLPVTRQIHWPTMAVAAVVLAAGMLGADYFLFPGAGLCLVIVLALYSSVTRRAFVRDHRRGMKLFHQKRFAEAAAMFEKSARSHAERPWVDRYRAIVLLSGSRISYREMALVNEAFCRVQLGEKEKARALYRQALVEFPGSAIAETALRFLE